MLGRQALYLTYPALFRALSSPPSWLLLASGVALSDALWNSDTTGTLSCQNRSHIYSLVYHFRPESFQIRKTLVMQELSTVPLPPACSPPPIYNTPKGPLAFMHLVSLLSFGKTVGQGTVKKEPHEKELRNWRGKVNFAYL